MTTGDPRLCIRIEVEGEVMSERWLDASDPKTEGALTSMGTYDASIVRQASEAGLNWALVIYDPEIDRSAVISSGGPGKPLSMGDAFDGASKGLWPWLFEE